MYKKSTKIGEKSLSYFDLTEVGKKFGKNIENLPISIKILLENIVRNFDDVLITNDDIKALLDYKNNSSHTIHYNPTRVLMQDFTGVPAVVDLAAMRDAVKKLNGDVKKINPKIPVDLVVDHSVQVDFFGDNEAFNRNFQLEMERNSERYEFLRWGQKNLRNFRVVPPGMGICHQVNIECLAHVVTEGADGSLMPDTLIGTDSHTTMVNALAVLGWGVGGIEAESVMLGQPIAMLVPEVIGFELKGKLRDGVTATDLVLTITSMLRKKKVVEKFVEFFGEGISNLSLADRATIANMAPEAGSTCNFFPIDSRVLDYLDLTGRSKEHIEIVEKYAKLQGLWNDPTRKIEFTDTMVLDLSTVEATLAGPSRPQDDVKLSKVPESFAPLIAGKTSTSAIDELSDGSIVIAAITSCTNTSNPEVLIAAGLVAKKAIELGLKKKDFVKTSLAPGSKVVTGYLQASGLQDYLDQLGFNLVGYGCTTCIGNSGPIAEDISKKIDEQNLVVAAILSGNRNFEGRIHAKVKANYLASPPLVVAYALVGSINLDITKDPIGIGKSGKPVFLKDLWPTNAEILEISRKFVDRNVFISKLKDIFTGDTHWQKMKVSESDLYGWDKNSTYVQRPPYFDEISEFKDIQKAKILALFGDSITTDHISPAGAIGASTPAGKYLLEHGVKKEDFNSYGSRRGNHNVMIRGTFANIRIKNKMLDGVEGGFTKYDGTVIPIYDAAMKYIERKVPTIIFAGKEYGTGSSRDWAAKGTNLLGIKAVVAESFERIHRSNLVGMGVLPLLFKNGDSISSLKLTGEEEIDIIYLANLSPKCTATCNIRYKDGSNKKIELLCAIDTLREVEYLKHGGILQYVLANK